MKKQNIKIRQATIRDVKKIVSLNNSYARQGMMLKRKDLDIIMNLRDYYVAVKPRTKKILGCAALHIYTDRLSEIRALAVRKGYNGLGIGQRLIKRCLMEAKDLGLPKVFVLTYIDTFFTKLGFKHSNREHLPHKIWEDCAKCAKKDNCTEICLEYVVPK